MCGPALPMITAATSIISTVAGMAGASAQQQAQANANRAQADQARVAAQIAERDATVADINARTALQQSHFEAQKTRAELRTQAARQYAQFAAAGLAPGEGSAGLVVNETQTRGNLDNLAQIWSGETSYTSHKNEATDLRIQSKAHRQAASTYERAANTLGGSGPLSLISMIVK